MPEGAYTNEQIFGLLAFAGFTGFMINYVTWFIKSEQNLPGPFKGLFKNLVTELPEGKEVRWKKGTWATGPMNKQPEEEMRRLKEGSWNARETKRTMDYIEVRREFWASKEAEYEENRKAKRALVLER